MSWWESQAVFWVSWKGRREETVKVDGGEGGEHVDIRLVPDGSRWGHWFSVSADMADNQASLAAEAWKTAGKVFWKTPKEKGEMIPLMELVGVRMLGPKNCAPSSLYGHTEGCQNVVPWYDEMAKAKLAANAPETDLFFALLSKEEEEDKLDPVAAAKKRMLQVAEERRAASKQLRYNDADDNELAREIAKAAPERGLFPVGYLEAIEEMDDLAPVLDL